MRTFIFIRRKKILQSVVLFRLQAQQYGLSAELCQEAFGVQHLMPFYLKLNKLSSIKTKCVKTMLDTFVILYMVLESSYLHDHILVCKKNTQKTITMYIL